MPPSGKKLAIDESGTRSRFRVFVSMVAGVMAFAVIVIFTLLPDRTRLAYVELSPRQIVDLKSIALVQQKSMAQIVQAEMQHLDIYAPTDGTIALRVLDQNLVERDDVLAKIAFVPEIPGGEKVAKEQLDRCRASHKALKTPRENLQSLSERVENAYRDYQSSKNRELQGRYVQGVDYFAKQVDAYFEEAREHAAEHSAQRPVSEELKRLGSEANRLRQERKMADHYNAKKEFFRQKAAFYDYFLADLEQKDAQLASLLAQTPREVNVASPKAGNLHWLVEDRQKVKSGEKIGTLDVVLFLKVVYNAIPDNDAVKALNWREGTQVRLQSFGREIPGIITHRIDHFEYTPHSFDLEIQLENTGDVAPGTTATLPYPQEETKWGVPVAAVMQDVQGSHVAVAKDGRIQRRNVQTGSREADYIVVIGVERGEKVVVPQPDSRPLEDGQTIKMKE